MKNINYASELLKLMALGNIPYKGMVIIKRGERFEVAGNVFTTEKAARDYIDRCPIALQNSIKLN